MQHPIHDEYASQPGYLFWFRDCTYPVRAADPHKYVSVEDLQTAEPSSEFHCQLFDLSQPEDLKKYKVVSQRIFDGWYSMLNLQRNWDTDSGKMRIWMEWTQDYLEVSDGV